MYLLSQVLYNSCTTKLLKWTSYSFVTDTPITWNIFGWFPNSCSHFYKGRIYFSCEIKCLYRNCFFFFLLGFYVLPSSCLRGRTWKKVATKINKPETCCKKTLRRKMSFQMLPSPSQEDLKEDSIVTNTS